MFKDDFNLDLMAQYAQIEKKHHWSIKVIGGPEEYKVWKAEQKLKEELRVKQNEARVAMVVKGIEEGTLANKYFGPSDTTITMKRFFEIEKEKLYKMNNPDNSISEYGIDQSKSVFKRIYDKIYNFFLNVKFEV